MVRIFLLIVLALIAGCSNSESVNSLNNYEPFSLDDGMVLVHASDKSVNLGTNDVEALPTVKPSMRVEFSYDFYIGKREVTFGEYGKVRGIHFDSELKNQPVSNVTFFDAVLYANALSKKHGLDTVYTYTKAVIDDDGHCVSMLDFSTRFDVDAFRLPTEAEWTLVAENNWKKACGEKPTVPCDFAGGVKEWVNDWLGGYRDTTLENYVGIFGGGFLNTRILKGGSFRDDSADVHVYDRSDVYPVTADLRMDYIGFRIAYGAIPNPVMTDYRGYIVHDDVKVLITSEEFRSIFGTMEAKLVFRNEASGNLMFVNFIGGDPVVHEIVDTMEVYHPAISPDGRYVAFSTVPEGVSSDKSTIFVRSLDIASGVVKRLRGFSGAIPRWRVLDSGDTVVVFVDYSGNNKDDAAFHAASTWQVVFGNAAFREDSKLFGGAYHGGISEDWRLAVTGARLLRAKRAKEGKTLLEESEEELWYGGEQACNASLAQDGSKRTLFLDFGGRTGRDFTGKQYGTHEMLLVADSLGNLVQGVPSPASYTFDHTEWTSNEDVVVATLVDKNGAHGKIVTVNLKDSSITELVEGNDVTYPDLWIGEKPVLAGKDTLVQDSAGAYMFAGGSMEMSLYRYKLELLWQYRDTADVVILGSSRPLAAVDPVALKHYFAVNLAQTPNSMAVSRALFERYVLGNVDRLRYIIVSLDIDFWWKDSTSDNFFYDRYKFYPGFVYDENHNYWKDDRDARILEYTRAAVGSEEADRIMYHRGLMVSSGPGWLEKPTILQDSLWNHYLPDRFDANVDILEDMVKLAGEHGVKVIGVIFPQNPNYRKTGAFGRYGIARSEAPELIAKISALEKKYDNFHLVDENKMGKHDYTSSMAENDDHLNRYGARVLSVRLDSVLVKLDSK
ncbi:MAG: TIGR02171 family protein [Fibrobacter sp.]|uniref:TIGR02171 family lipoprotein n=1 Tax=Fibrobacter sp. TaxID=35828 RepID=UPI0025BF8EDF|nr:TIGR02171 family protein [Fibrobacter sp.]MBR4785814.1 TIGR02171 family protein [Fibrobacter sp.]